MRPRSIVTSGAGATGAVGADPRGEISRQLARVNAEVAAACRRVGRDPREVTVIGVSKTHPLEVVGLGVAAGLTDFGENRAQEFVPKAAGAAAAGLPVRWHFIGHLQRNKVRQVLPAVSVLHSLDSPGLIEETTRRWQAGLRPPSGRPVDCYVEVNVSGEAQKHGSTVAQLPTLLRLAGGSEALRVVGLMTVAPRTGDPDSIRPIFRALRDLARAHGLAGLSMGMTEDYRVAIEEGATVVRIGRAIFGDRRG